MSFRSFQVRDVSSYYNNEPTFDVVYHDDEHGVVRYSDSVWSSHFAAEQEADRLERSKAAPTHWEVAADA